ncbi:hypothetical protein GHV40_20745 [Devosia sp. D6-9]|nr:hypothetical protein GHV40_20745 [Devosia sp. D6-9]
MMETMMHEQKPLSRDDEWKYAEKALTWYGWGSPVGLGFALVALGVAALLARFAIVGF